MPLLKAPEATKGTSPSFRYCVNFLALGWISLKIPSVPQIANFFHFDISILGLSAFDNILVRIIFINCSSISVELSYKTKSSILFLNSLGVMFDLKKI